MIERIDLGTGKSLLQSSVIKIGFRIFLRVFLVKIMR